MATAIMAFVVGLAPIVLVLLKAYLEKTKAAQPAVRDKEIDDAFADQNHVAVGRELHELRGRLRRTHGGAE